MTVHPNGVDSQLYGYWPLPRRRKLKWPNDAPVAISINLFFESMLHETPDGFFRDVRWRERFPSDIRLYSWFDYGNRVAIFRILNALDRHRFKVTVPANAYACERFPNLVEAFRNRGWEIAAHGLAANAIVSGRLSEQQEQNHLAEVLNRVECATKERPVGWFGQDFGESTRTPALLNGLGLRYLADWSNDDQPYPMSGAGRIMSVPNYCEWDDMRLLWDRRLQMPRYPEIVGDAFRQLYSDGAVTGRFFSLNLHPWLIGAAHRIKYLEQVLDMIASMPSIWQATTRDIVQHVSSLG